MKRQPTRGLVPLRAAAGLPEDARVRAEARLRRAWYLVVGPALVNQTRLLRVYQGVLVVGCWNPALVPNLRKAAEATWPQVQERLRTLYKLNFRAMEVVPCDPPEAPAPAPPANPRDPDPLKAVLRFLRERKNG